MLRSRLAIILLRSRLAIILLRSGLAIILPLMLFERWIRVSSRWWVLLVLTIILPMGMILMLLVLPEHWVKMWAKWQYYILMKWC